ncbi:hypothetical protein PoB_006541400 [Plakobranchus ocellatus]|uniref:USP domain-containing protein n=1 Tax=Plakobranchus ocellatus TaxID=259542 RepID=A0AAV4D440_9GAST|nr:hypothetical protein PoB_006541400 [Plakobranchus ocellatus]
MWPKDCNPWTRYNEKKNMKGMGSYGKSKFGVYLNRYFDVEVKHAYLNGSSSDVHEIAVVKYFTGKCKPLNIGNVLSKKNNGVDVEPTPNYDSHISSVPPSLDESTYVQKQKSEIYLYEYDEQCEPCRRPRQCLPHAIIKIKKKPLPQKTVQPPPAPSVPQGPNPSPAEPTIPVTNTSIPSSSKAESSFTHVSKQKSADIQAMRTTVHASKDPLSSGTERRPCKMDAADVNKVTSKEDKQSKKVSFINEVDERRREEMRNSYLQRLSLAKATVQAEQSKELNSLQVLPNLLPQQTSVQHNQNILLKTNAFQEVAGRKDPLSGSLPRTQLDNAELASDSFNLKSGIQPPASSVSSLNETAKSTVGVLPNKRIDPRLMRSVSNPVAKVSSTALDPRLARLSVDEKQRAERSPEPPGKAQDTSKGPRFLPDSSKSALKHGSIPVSEFKKRMSYSEYKKLKKDSQAKNTPSSSGSSSAQTDTSFHTTSSVSTSKSLALPMPITFMDVSKLPPKPSAPSKADVSVDKTLVPLPSFYKEYTPDDQPSSSEVDFDMFQSPVLDIRKHSSSSQAKKSVTSKKPLLPLPVFNSDGSISNVLRGFVDGSITEIKTPSPAESQQKPSNKLLIKPELVKNIAKNLLKNVASVSETVKQRDKTSRKREGGTNDSTKEREERKPEGEDNLKNLTMSKGKSNEKIVQGMSKGFQKCSDGIQRNASSQRDQVSADSSQENESSTSLKGEGTKSDFKLAEKVECETIREENGSSHKGLPTNKKSNVKERLSVPPLPLIPFLVSDDREEDCNQPRKCAGQQEEISKLSVESGPEPGNAQDQEEIPETVPECSHPNMPESPTFDMLSTGMWLAPGEPHHCAVNLSATLTSPSEISQPKVSGFESAPSTSGWEDNSSAEKSDDVSSSQPEAQNAVTCVSHMIDRESETVNTNPFIATHCEKTTAASSNSPGRERQMEASSSSSVEHHLAENFKNNQSVSEEAVVTTDRPSCDAQSVAREEEEQCHAACRTLKELGFVDILQVMNNESYQPCTVVVDCIKAVNDNYPLDTCQTCRDWLPRESLVHIRTVCDFEPCSNHGLCESDEPYGASSDSLSCHDERPSAATHMDADSPSANAQQQGPPASEVHRGTNVIWNVSEADLVDRLPGRIVTPHGQNTNTATSSFASVSWGGAERAENMTQQYANFPPREAKQGSFVKSMASSTINPTEAQKTSISSYPDLKQRVENQSIWNTSSSKPKALDSAGSGSDVSQMVTKDLTANVDVSGNACVNISKSAGNREGVVVSNAVSVAAHHVSSTKEMSLRSSPLCSAKPVLAQRTAASEGSSQDIRRREAPDTVLCSDDSTKGSSEQGRGSVKEPGAKYGDSVRPAYPDSVGKVAKESMAKEHWKSTGTPESNDNLKQKEQRRDILMQVLKQKEKVQKHLEHDIRKACRKENMLGKRQSSGKDKVKQNGNEDIRGKFDSSNHKRKEIRSERYEKQKDPRYKQTNKERDPEKSWAEAKSQGYDQRSNEKFTKDKGRQGHSERERSPEKRSVLEKKSHNRKSSEEYRARYERNKRENERKADRTKENVNQRDRKEDRRDYLQRDNRTEAQVKDLERRKSSEDVRIATLAGRHEQEILNTSKDKTETKISEISMCRELAQHGPLQQNAWSEDIVSTAVPEKTQSMENVSGKYGKETTIEHSGEENSVEKGAIIESVTKSKEPSFQDSITKQSSSDSHDPDDGDDDEFGAPKKIIQPVKKKIVINLPQSTPRGVSTELFTTMDKSVSTAHTTVTHTLSPAVAQAFGSQFHPQVSSHHDSSLPPMSGCLKTSESSMYPESIDSKYDATQALSIFVPKTCPDDNPCDELYSPSNPTTEDQPSFDNVHQNSTPLHMQLTENKSESENEPSLEYPKNYSCPPRQTSETRNIFSLYAAPGLSARISPADVDSNEYGDIDYRQTNPANKQVSSWQKNSSLYGNYNSFPIPEPIQYGAGMSEKSVPPSAMSDSHHRFREQNIYESSHMGFWRGPEKFEPYDYGDKDYRLQHSHNPPFLTKQMQNYGVDPERSENSFNIFSNVSGGNSMSDGYDHCPQNGNKPNSKSDQEDNWTQSNMSGSSSNQHSPPQYPVHDQLCREPDHSTDHGLATGNDPDTEKDVSETSATLQMMLPEMFGPASHRQKCQSILKAFSKCKPAATAKASSTDKDKRDIQYDSDKAEITKQSFISSRLPQSSTGTVSHKEFSSVEKLKEILANVHKNAAAPQTKQSEKIDSFVQKQVGNQDMVSERDGLLPHASGREDEPVLEKADSIIKESIGSQSLSSPSINMAANTPEGSSPHLRAATAQIVDHIDQFVQHIPNLSTLELKKILGHFKEKMEARVAGADSEAVTASAKENISNPQRSCSQQVPLGQSQNKSPVGSSSTPFLPFGQEEICAPTLDAQSSVKKDDFSTVEISSKSTSLDSELIELQDNTVVAGSRSSEKKATPDNAIVPGQKVVANNRDDILPDSTSALLDVPSSTTSFSDSQCSTSKHSLVDYDGSGSDDNDHTVQVSSSYPKDNKRSPVHHAVKEADDSESRHNAKFNSATESDIFVLNKNILEKEDQRKPSTGETVVSTSSDEMCETLVETPPDDKNPKSSTNINAAYRRPAEKVALRHTVGENENSNLSDMLEKKLSQSSSSRAIVVDSSSSTNESPVVTKPSQSSNTASVTAGTKSKVYLKDVPMDILSYARDKILHDLNELIDLDTNPDESCQPEDSEEPLGDLKKTKIVSSEQKDPEKPSDDLENVKLDSDTDQTTEDGEIKDDENDLSHSSGGRDEEDTIVDLSDLDEDNKQEVSSSTPAKICKKTDTVFNKRQQSESDKDVIAVSSENECNHQKRPNQTRKRTTRGKFCKRNSSALTLSPTLIEKCKEKLKKKRTRRKIRLDRDVNIPGMKYSDISEASSGKEDEDKHSRHAVALGHRPGPQALNKSSTTARKKRKPKASPVRYPQEDKVEKAGLERRYDNSLPTNTVRNQYCSDSESNSSFVTKTHMPKKMSSKQRGEYSPILSSPESRDAESSFTPGRDFDLVDSNSTSLSISGSNQGQDKPYSPDLSPANLLKSTTVSPKRKRKISLQSKSSDENISIIPSVPKKRVMSKVCKLLDSQKDFSLKKLRESRSTSRSKNKEDKSKSPSEQSRAKRNSSPGGFRVEKARDRRSTSSGTYRICKGSSVEPSGANRNCSSGSLRSHSSRHRLSLSRDSDQSLSSASDRSSPGLSRSKRRRNPGPYKGQSRRKSRSRSRSKVRRRHSRSSSYSPYRSPSRPKNRYGSPVERKSGQYRNTSPASRRKRRDNHSPVSNHDYDRYERRSSTSSQSPNRSVTFRRSDSHRKHSNERSPQLCATFSNNELDYYTSRGPQRKNNTVWKDLPTYSFDFSTNKGVSEGTAKKDVDRMGLDYFTTRKERNSIPNPFSEDTSDKRVVQLVTPEPELSSFEDLMREHEKQRERRLNPSNVTIEKLIITHFGAIIPEQIKDAFPFPLTTSITHDSKGNLRSEEDRQQFASGIVEAFGLAMGLPHNSVNTASINFSSKCFDKEPTEKQLEEFADQQVLLEVNVIKQCQAFLQASVKSMPEETMLQEKTLEQAKLQAEILLMQAKQDKDSSQSLEELERKLSDVKEECEHLMQACVKHKQLEANNKDQTGQSDFPEPDIPEALRLPTTDFEFHKPSYPILQGKVKSELEALLDQVAGDILELYKCPGFGRPHFRVPDLLLLKEEKQSLYALCGTPLILNMPIPKKPFSLLLKIRVELESLGPEVRDSPEGMKLLTERSNLLGNFVITMKASRITKLKTKVRQFDCCSDYLHEVLGSEGLEKLKVFETYLQALRWHYRVLDQENKCKTNLTSWNATFADRVGAKVSSQPARDLGTSLVKSLSPTTDALAWQR